MRVSPAILPLMRAQGGGRVSVKRITVHEYECRHAIVDETITDESGNTLYSVCDIDQCPEGSTFNASDWVNAVNYGMKLTRQGYDSVKVETVTLRREW